MQLSRLGLNRVIKKHGLVMLTLRNRSFKDFRMEEYEFRDKRFKGGAQVSPYQAQFTLTEEEKILNEKLPIQDRVLDFNKYLNHKGKLKPSTGAALSDVEPFPRLKIMMLCSIINDLINEFDKDFVYARLVKEFVKYIMEVVDEHESIPEIETAFPNYESVEYLIEKLHDEVTLLRYLLKKDRYKVLTNQKQTEDDDEEISNIFFGAAYADSANDEVGEKNTHMKHNKGNPLKAKYSF